MALMRSTFIYSNSAPDMDAIEHQLSAADRAGYTVDLRRAFWECVPPLVSALERPQLRALMQRLANGDVVVVMQLSCLGRSVQDVLATIMRFRKLGVGLYCVELGRADLARRSPPMAVTLLRAIAAIDEATRSERMRASAAEAKANGKQLGRRPSLGKAERNGILQSLSDGASVSEVARFFGTSRQTVLRIRTSHAEQNGPLSPLKPAGGAPPDNLETESPPLADRPGRA